MFQLTDAIKENVRKQLPLRLVVVYTLHSHLDGPDCGWGAWDYQVCSTQQELDRLIAECLDEGRTVYEYDADDNSVDDGFPLNAEFTSRWLNTPPIGPPVKKG